MRKILVENWKDCWKWLTTWATVAIAALATAYEYSAEFREYLPEGWFKYAMIAIIVARLINQTKKPKDE